MRPALIEAEKAEPLLDWIALTEALCAGHDLPPAEIADTLLYRGADTLLTRSAWIDGLGIAVKSATIFPGNAARSLPSVNGGVSLYSDGAGLLEAIVDFHLVTKWKTAAGSLLAARLLARPDSDRIAIIGAGKVAGSLIEAYGALFPAAEFRLWNRSGARAAEFAAAHPDVAVAADLRAVVEWADIVACATMATEPVLCGEWLRPGQHVDLIGAYRPDMREADDVAMRRARIFVDSRQTTIAHIGELATPIAAGVITPDDVIADFRGIATGAFARGSADEITLFKNGGGAHLDLMTCRYILERWRAHENGRA